MADKRISGFPAATQWHPDAFIPQDNPAGLTEKVTPAQVETKLEADGFIKAASPSLGQVAAYTAGGWAPIKLADANIDAAAAIGWGKISKSGAVATDVGALPEIVVTGAVNFNSINSGLPCSAEIDASSTSNAPSGFTSGKAHLLQSKGATNWLTQTLTAATAVAFRGMTSPGVWGSWRYVWDDAYLPISALGLDLLNDLTAYSMRLTLGALASANPTATGTLTAPDVVVSNLAGTGTRPAAIDSTGKLVVSGGENSFAVKSASFTLSASTERVIRTQGAITVTLPAASSLQGYSYTFLQEQVGGGALTFSPPEPWFSSVSASAWVEHAGSWGFSIAWRRADLTSDGLNWLATLQ
jgi:hypothetical protein